MIQDIAPSKLDNSFKDYKIREEDSLLIFGEDGKLYVGEEGGRMIFATGSEVEPGEACYLFSVDEKRFFLSLDNTRTAAPEGFFGNTNRKVPEGFFGNTNRKVPEGFSGNTNRKVPEGFSGNMNRKVPEGFSGYTIREVRDKFSGEDDVNVYVAFTAYHLWKWYSDNRFCGRCGKPLTRSEKERALVCPDCENVIYPRINPAVIVGVTKGDTLLLTRYRRGYAHNALVAGFTEIGETLEETVAREVMEETGVKVKNIRYYKSQPWGMAQDMLMGFYCDADDDGEIKMDENELKYAEWVRREDIELQPNNLSLTNEMMKMFKEGKI